MKIKKKNEKSYRVKLIVRNTHFSNDTNKYNISFFIFCAERPTVSAGIRDLRVLKTTKSAFKDFVDDEFRKLPYSDDRIFSSVIACAWTYSTTEGVCFDKAW